MGRRIRVAQPEIGQAGPAGEADFPIHDQKFAMIAMINPGQIVPDERVITADIDAGLAHPAQGTRIQSSGADPVQQDMDVDASLGPLGQSFGKLLANLAGPIDVGFQVD